MGYLHIPNLYRPEAQAIFLFKECFALEKIHGTSAHVCRQEDGQLKFFSGGEKHEKFCALFNQEELAGLFSTTFLPGQKVTVFGEAYGGKCQGMSATYGPNLKFVAFDVQVGDCWLSVEDAAKACDGLRIEFVHFNRVATTLSALNEVKSAFSIQAVRNGMGVGHKREGVVIRPVVEMTLNNGSRVISKHKNDEFMETKTPRAVDAGKLKAIEDAQEVAEEWVTPMRMAHILDKIPGHSIEKMPDILRSMVEDVMREGAGEVPDDQAVRRAISGKTARMYKELLKASIPAGD